MGRIAFKFGADIHIPLRVYCHHFYDPQTFLLVLQSQCG